MADDNLPARLRELADALPDGFYFPGDASETCRKAANMIDYLQGLDDAAVVTRWVCGCGTNNGINLSVCRVCGRREGER